MKLAAFLLLVLCAEITGKTCHETQVEFCDSERRLRCICKTCISCPVGYGPSKQCGGSYLNGTAIKCVPCRPGIDFSEEDGIASCESCPQCGGRKTIRKCTPKRKSVCSHECRKGYRMDPVVEDCVPITVVTSARPITKKSTTLTRKTAIMTSLSSSNKLQSTSTNNKNISPTKPITENTLLRPNQAEKLTMIILVAVFMGVVVLVVMSATVWLCVSIRKTCTRPNQDAKEDEAAIPLTDMPSTNSPSPRSSEESIEDQHHPWPKNFRFQDIPSKLTNYLAVKLSQPNDANGWRMMGEKLGVEEIELDGINISNCTEYGKSKGGNLFVYLKASTPSLTLSKVVSVLKKMDRNDLVEEIEKRMTLICKEGENDALV